MIITGAENARDLVSQDRPPPAAVYAARKTIKRMRAAARLMRVVAPARARAVGAACREAGRALSAARDQEAAAEAACALAAAAQDPDARAGLDALAQALGRAPAPSPADAARAADFLNAARRLADRLARRKDGATVLAEGLALLDKRARRAFKRLKAAPDDERLHDWRKREKDRFHAARLLRKVWPADRPWLAERLQEIGQVLGEDRDLLLVLAAIDAAPERCGGDAEPVRALIAARRRMLEAEAMALGRALYDRSAEDEQTS